MSDKPKAETRTIPTSVLTEMREAVRDEGREPRLSLLVQHFFDVAGGERAVARMLWDELHNPTTSPHIRSRILDTVLKALQSVNARTVATDLSDMTGEDIDRELMRVFKEQHESGGQPGETPTGRRQEPA